MSKISDMMNKEIRAMIAKNSELLEMTPIDCMLVMRFRKKDKGYHTHYLFPGNINVANDMFIGIGEKLREERVSKSGLILPRSWIDGA